MSSRAEEKAAARRARVQAEAAEAAKAQRLRRIRVLLGAGLVALLAVVIAIAVGSGGGDSGSKAQVKSGGTGVAALFAGVPQHGLTLGSPKAPVTIEEYIDPQCPYCAQFSRTALPTVISKYVRPGKVRIVLRPLAFIGPDSVTAAKVLVAASKQDKGWPFIDVFYANQQQENSGYVTPDFLRRIGNAVPGLDIGKAMKVADDDPSVLQTLQTADSRAKAAGADSTPTLIMHQNGKAQQITLDASDYVGSVSRALDAALAQ